MCFSWISLSGVLKRVLANQIKQTKLAVYTLYEATNARVVNLWKNYVDRMKEACYLHGVLDWVLDWIRLWVLYHLSTFALCI